MVEEVTDHEYRLSSIILCLMQRLGIESIVLSPLEEVDNVLSVLVVSIEDEDKHSMRVQRMTKDEADDTIEYLNNKRKSKMQ